LTKKTSYKTAETVCRTFWNLPCTSGFGVGVVTGNLVDNVVRGGGFSNIREIQSKKGAVRVNNPSLMHTLRKLVIPTSSYC
jgi:hypothetical protein